MIRVRAVDPTRGFRLGDQVILGTAFDVRDTFRGGPNDGASIPDGTKMPNIGLFQWDGHGQTSGYDANTATGGGGDRLIMSRAQVRLTKDAPFTTTEAGNPIVWTLRPSVVAGTGEPPSPRASRSRTSCPSGLTFDQDCTQAGLPSGITIGSVDYDTPVVGQTTVRFELGDRVGGVAIPPISVCTETDPFYPPNYDVINTATVASPNAPSPLALRRDTATVRLLQQASFSIAKVVDRRVDLQDDDQVWSFRWSNFSTNLPFSDVDVIDVFPFNGDGDPDAGAPRNNVASDFQGTLTLSGPLDQPIRQPLHRARRTGYRYLVLRDGGGSQDHLVRPPRARQRQPRCTRWAVVHGGRDRLRRHLSGRHGPRSAPCASWRPLDLPAGDYVTATLPLQATGQPAGRHLRQPCRGRLEHDADADPALQPAVRAGARLQPRRPGVLGHRPQRQVRLGHRCPRPGRHGPTSRTSSARRSRPRPRTPMDAGSWSTSTPVSVWTTCSARATGWSSRPASSSPVVRSWATGRPSNPTNPDLDQNEPIDQHSRDLGEPATFGSSSALVTLSADASGPVIRGGEPLGDNVADLGNPLMGDSFTQLTVDMGFEPLPRLAMVKSITSGPTPLANGNVRIVYRVRVTNTGPGAGTYSPRRPAPLRHAASAS